MERKDNFIKKYLKEVGSICERISSEDIDVVIRLLYDAWKENKHIFIAGNGGSAATATHFASDLAKFTSVEGKQRIKASALTDNVPWITAITNDLGWGNVFIEQLKNLMDEGDVFIAISVHGGSGEDKAGTWSQNLLAAARFVKEKKGKIIGLAGFDGGVFKKISDACVVVPMNSTPHVEGFHLVLTHLICARLKELIERA
jgi:D-sedoheptulose 7-phosphate isomerase